ncbi:MAG: hypothetical protein ACRDY2_08885 [Acidimicrobiales bacterium]
MHKVGSAGRPHWRSKVGSAGACLVAAGALAACGTAKPAGPPKAQLQSSVSSLDSSPTVSVDLHLAATAAQLHAVAPTIPTPFDSLITGASVVIQETTTNGKPLASVAKAVQASGSPTAALDSLRQVDEDLAVNGGGYKLLEIRFVKGVVYARADVKDFLGLFGISPTSLASVKSKIPSGSQYDFERAALAGKWVSFDALSALQGFLSTAPVGSPAQTKALLAKVYGAISTVYTKDITVAAAGSGPKGTTKLAVSANEHKLVADVVGAFAQVFPSGVAGLPAPNLSKVPNHTITADALLKGTALSGFQLNISQFLHSAAAASNPLVVSATISHPSVSISAPSGATSASLPALAKLFQGASASKGAPKGSSPATA